MSGVRVLSVGPPIHGDLSKLQSRPLRAYLLADSIGVMDARSTCGRQSAPREVTT